MLHAIGGADSVELKVSVPDSDRIPVLSALDEAFMIAAEMRVFLARHGVDTEASQDTKTSTALTTLAARLPDSGAYHDSQQEGDRR